MPLVDSILRVIARSPIAEQPVDFSRLPAYRFEYFPDSGPKPWLDRADWSQQLEALPAQQAALCRQWAENWLRHPAQVNSRIAARFCLAGL